MASFDENGKYNKTNWKAGDKITATKLNKIEESIEAINDNDISRHVEADARLDALEAKDVVHDKELINIKNTIADNKAAAELGDYDINSRMTFLENELNEGIEEVHNVANTVDGKIATAETNMTTQVNQGKADMEAMIAEVEVDLEGLHAKDEELNNILNTHIHDSIIVVDNNEDLIYAISDNTHDTIDLKKGTYSIDTPLTVQCKILGNGSTINVTSTITTSGSCKLYDINFRGSNCEIDCINLVGGATIEGCNFVEFHNAIFQTGISVHGLIKRNTFQYNRNGIYLQNAGPNSVNNLTVENNYFVKHGTSADDLTADSTEPAFPNSMDTSAQGTGLDDIVGVGLICKSGCNGVFVHNNVFEYNSFCGVLVYQSNGNKTNDVKITSNYFEGNKTSGIVMVNLSSIGELMQTEVHDNYYARINGQNSDFYSHDLKCIGSHNSSLRLVNSWGHQPLWHPVDEEHVNVVGAHVVRESNGREYYDLIVGASKQYFMLPTGTYIQPYGTSYEPVPFIFEYKVKLNSALSFCDGTKTTNAVMKTFEAGEHVGMEIVPGWISSVKYITRALEADEYFRIYQMYPVSMLL